MKMPRFIEADKANHRVRGSEIAGVSASMVIVAAGLILKMPHALVLAAGAITAPVSACAAGWAVEKWQARVNAKAIAKGRLALHAIEHADITATAWGAWPVSSALGVAAIIFAITGESA